MPLNTSVRMIEGPILSALTNPDNLESLTDVQRSPYRFFYKEIKQSISKK